MQSAVSPLSFSFEPPAPRERAEPSPALVVHFPSGIPLASWHLSVCDRRVVCGGDALDLARAPLMLKLFRLFCAGPDPVVHRETLLHAVYGRRELISCSERLLESKRANCIKLVSRARALASEHLCRRDRERIEWFPYDYVTRCWALVGLKS